MPDFHADIWIAGESAEFAALLEGTSLDSHVPGCPSWTLRELAWHLGRVQRFWAKVVRARADVEPVFSPPMPGPAEPVELQEWMRSSTRDLLDALHDVSADTPAWTWWHDNRTVGAIARHQVQEAAVHRWDAHSAIGETAIIPQPVAIDGVDEFLWVARQLRDPAPIVFVATDADLRIAVSDAPPRVTVSGTASDVVLLLHGRISTDHIDINGERSFVDAYLTPVA